MKHFALACALALTPLPALTQEPEPEPDIGEGFSLMEEGARLMFRGLLREMEPTIDEFSGMADDMGPMFEMMATEMGPALMDLMRQVDSLRHYAPPEILPNGDIIIRRREDAPLFVPPPPEDEIEL